MACATGVMMLIVAAIVWSRLPLERNVGSGGDEGRRESKSGTERHIRGFCPTRLRAKNVIRRCTQQDLSVMYEIINDAAQAYRGVIPEDRWQEPYMPIDELKLEIDDGVEFWGYEEAGDLIGVMGLQDKGDVHLIRHAYVRTNRQYCGIGTRLLRHLEQMTDKPILVGTWADATWAITFYEKNGYRLLSRSETERLLKKYWKIPERQVVTSVVLADVNYGKWIKRIGMTST
jgi:N-acetylglutamate synthase-like GNAT family acetyltransferase